MSSVRFFFFFWREHTRNWQTLTHSLLSIFVIKLLVGQYVSTLSSSWSNPTSRYLFYAWDKICFNAVWEMLLIIQSHIISKILIPMNNYLPWSSFFIPQKTLVEAFLAMSMVVRGHFSSCHASRFDWASLSTSVASWANPTAFFFFKNKRWTWFSK